MDILNKKGPKAGVGSSLGPKEQKKYAPMHMDLEEEEEEMQPMEHKKRILPMFLQLLDQDMMTCKDFNDILNTTFIAYPFFKKPKTRLSLVNIMNPQPISSTIPLT
jgi:hypothetical protein